MIPIFPPILEILILESPSYKELDWCGHERLRGVLLFVYARVGSFSFLMLVLSVNVCIPSCIMINDRPLT
jgi:hypothetical protein